MKKPGIICFFLIISAFYSHGFTRGVRDRIITTSLRNYGLITKSWNIDDGLPGDRVHNFVMDRTGFLWLATNQGLARFDGSAFKTYSSQNVKIFHDSYFSNIVCDKNNHLFFINDNRIIKKEGNSFRVVDAGFPEPELFTDIAIDSTGILWAGTRGKGLLKLEDKKLETVNSSFGLNVKRISALTFDGDNVLYLGSGSHGVYKKINGRFINIIDGNRLPSRHIRKLFVDSDKNLWVATNKGLVIFRYSNGSLQNKCEIITGQIVNSITQDNDKNIWIGTLKRGILIYSRGKLLKFSTGNGLSDNIITQISVYGDNIWVGTNKGGINLIRKAQIFSIGKKEGLAEDYVNSVYEDEDGSILIGTTSGIYKTRLPFSRKACVKLPILKNDHIFAINRNPAGDIMVGTRYNGLFIYGKNGVARYNMSNGLDVNFIRCLFTDRDSSVWAGTNGGGIAVIKNGKIRKITRENGLSSNLIAFIHKSRDGKYWVGTSGGGINILDKDGDIKIINRDDGLGGNIISSIYEEKSGNIWLTINGGGVSLIKQGKVHTFTTSDGLFTNVILNLVCDSSGTFWFSTPKGIFSVRKSSFTDYMSGKIKQVRYRYFDSSDGMIASRCVGTSPQTAAITRGNTALFSTTRGLVEIDPSLIKTGDEKIRLYFNRVLVNNYPEKTRALTSIPPNPERIEFSFGAINFRSPDKIHFKCRLTGVDKNWIDLGRNKNIGYSHLPYGKYTFYLAGYDPGNNKMIGETKISFFIEPHFWETLYFRIFFSLFIIILLVLLTRYINKRQYVRKINALEAEKALEKERMRISTDMHDEFGASLSKISLLSEIAKNNISNKSRLEDLVNEISDSGRTLAASMDEIVWAVNPKNDRLDKMLYYISNYFSNHLSLTDISFRVQIPDELPGSFVSAEVRHNIFSVIKEGMNNTLKHSGASQIELIFSYTGGVLQIQLADNGRGINFGAVNEFNNGLNNMKKRMDSIGGNIEIRNGKKNGVEIIAVLKI